MFPFQRPRQSFAPMPIDPLDMDRKDEALKDLQARMVRIETRLCQLMEHIGVKPHGKNTSSF